MVMQPTLKNADPDIGVLELNALQRLLSGKLELVAPSEGAAGRTELLNRPVSRYSAHGICICDYAEATITASWGQNTRHVVA